MECSKHARPQLPLPQLRAGTKPTITLSRRRWSRALHSAGDERAHIENLRAGQEPRRPTVLSGSPTRHPRCDCRLVRESGPALHTWHRGKANLTPSSNTQTVSGRGTCASLLVTIHDISTHETPSRNDTHLLHDSLENRNLQAGNTASDCQPLEEIEVDMTEWRVQGKTKKDSSAQSRPVVLWNGRSFCCRWNDLCHRISDAPQERSCYHFGEDRSRLQVLLVPREEASTRWFINGNFLAGIYGRFG